jgi:putative FmdB family regulatory protein
MPIYDYMCSDCGNFDALRPTARRDDAAECPACGELSVRVFANGPHLARLDADTRRAMDGNVRAAHAPVSSKDYESGYKRLKHPSGCGCCGTSKRSATQTFANGNKTFVGKRPWMISH